jgi:RND family efflux transporter MFP subunit
MARKSIITEKKDTIVAAVPTNLINKIQQHPQRKWLMGAGLVALVIVIFLVYKLTRPSTAAVSYQTATVETGTLVNSVSASGTVTNGVGQSIMTQASGVVQKVYVQNGDTVKKGQKIADITLDQDGQQRQASAWSTYLSAKNGLASAQAKINSLQSAEFKANQKFITDAVARDLVDSDPTFIQQKADWLQAEADYKNQTGVIQQAQASVNNAWISYQQTSATILAPANGVVDRFTLVPGLLISTTSNSSNSSGASSQKVGMVVPTDLHIQLSVSLAEIDAAKVKPGQAVTVTLDSMSDKTFTGKVLIVDTNGAVSSGVTTYPAVIQLDDTAEGIYPNMAATARIITKVQDNVLLVPTTAVQTSNGQSVVNLLKNGQAVPTVVTTGGSDDTNTAILTGVAAGDIIVTNPQTARTRTTTTTGTTSVFSAISGNRSFGGAPAGAAVRVMGR